MIWNVVNSSAKFSWEWLQGFYLVNRKFAYKAHLVARGRKEEYYNGRTLLLLQLLLLLVDVLWRIHYDLFNILSYL